jgi:caffeoyl-CoA O-methyltransferase
MKRKSRNHTDAAFDYVLQESLRVPEGMAGLMSVTARHEYSQMATDPEQGQFLAFLIRAMGATHILEIGVFTGVGTLWMADAAGADGRVVACDLSDEFVSVGKPYWEEAGVTERIDLRIGPAEQTLHELIAGGEEGTFDFCYVDADKDAYDVYYECVLKLLRPGGVIAFDNMLLGDRVAEPSITAEPVPSIRALNTKLHHDARVDVSFLTLCDGLYLVRKR